MFDHVQSVKQRKVGVGYGAKMMDIQKVTQNAIIVMQNSNVMIK